jgi:cytochrome oxidase Cu insertion factor (SCO1/SenC/PrrC family)
MANGKRIILILLVLLGPGSIIYFIAKNVKNHFIELPYLGYEYTVHADGSKDSTAYQIPDFTLTKFDGTKITRDSIRGEFIVLSTIQNTCPNPKACGMGVFLFNEIFFHKLVKNKDNYNNVKVISILTDENGKPIDSISPALTEEMVDFDKSLWWMTTGDVTPFYNFNYYGKKFYEHAADPAAGEIGDFAFTNSLVLIDDKGYIRAVTGAKSDSDIRNFFDMLKLLKKEEFDRKRAEQSREK